MSPSTPRRGRRPTPPGTASERVCTQGRKDESADLSEVRDQLRASALRVTRARLAALTAVRARPHADTETVINAVRDDIGSVSHQTVYDALRALTDGGLLRRIQPAGSVARYEARVDDNHHHVVCRGCGVVADVDCTIGEAPCLTPTEGAGFSIDEAEVIYWGRCNACVLDHDHSTDADQQKGTS